KITPPKGITKTYPASVAVCETMATKINIGVRSFFGVICNIDFNPALIKPECSATPTPNMATKTIPKGANPVKVVTIFDKKSAKAELVNKLLISIASPVVGSISEKLTVENTADKTQMTNIKRKNKIAGS